MWLELEPELVFGLAPALLELEQALLRQELAHPRPEPALMRPEPALLEPELAFKGQFVSIFYIFIKILLFFAQLELELELHGTKALSRASALVWAEFLLELGPKIKYFKAPATII